MDEFYLILDIGGTWLKGLLLERKEKISDYIIDVNDILRVPSRLGSERTTVDFIEALEELTEKLVQPWMKIGSVGVSVAGIVNYAGSGMDICASHLSPLRDEQWVEWLRRRFNAPVILANDADAAAAGAAVCGYLKGYHTIGIMPIGTGLGFTLWRNGRRWDPNFRHPLFGCIETPCGTYDYMASASRVAAEHPENNLVEIFKDRKYVKVVDDYLERLASIIRTSYYLYNTDYILIGGGLAGAVLAAGYPLAEKITEKLLENPVLTGAAIRVEVMREANLLPLFGMLSIAIGEESAQNLSYIPDYDSLKTEMPYDTSLRLHAMSSSELATCFWRAEQEAGEQLRASLGKIAAVADKIAEVLSRGGRLIYVGAGTSGRLAAVDTVELACTFGFPRERVLTFIAGGLSEAAVEIESNFEEDASCVPEMVLADVTASDVVIGISVSGYAYYVQSALAYAKSKGAYSVLVTESDFAEHPFCDTIVGLCSGRELIAGSTRMKAGTATKKILNFLSTISMLRLGKVYGCYMTELECLNEKLQQRAVHILKILFDLKEEEAIRFLKDYDYKLNDVIERLRKD